MGHPDQHTPDGHGVTRRDDAPKPQVSDSLAEDLEDPALEDAADTGATVRTPDPEANRQGEAGNDYVGRQMDDGLKANPRIEDASRVKEE